MHSYKAKPDPWVPCLLLLSVFAYCDEKCMQMQSINCAFSSLKVDAKVQPCSLAEKKSLCYKFGVCL